MTLLVFLMAPGSRKSKLLPRALPVPTGQMVLVDVSAIPGAQMVQMVANVSTRGLRRPAARRRDPSRDQDPCPSPGRGGRASRGL